MSREALIRSLILPLLLILAGCGGGGSDRVVLRGGTEHMPLAHDRTLRYREQDGGSAHDYTLQMEYGGGKVVRSFDAAFKGIDMGQCTFNQNGSRVFFTTSKPTTALIALPEYRQLWVDETVSEGDEWEDMDMGTKTLFAGYETVTVPAGTFERCYKTVVTILPAFMDSLNAWRENGTMSPEEFREWASNANDVTVRWFAPKVGLVKEELNGPDHTRELVAVVKPGTGKSGAGTDTSESE